MSRVQFLLFLNFLSLLLTTIIVLGPIVLPKYSLNINKIYQPRNQITQPNSRSIGYIRFPFKHSGTGFFISAEGHFLTTYDLLPKSICNPKQCKGFQIIRNLESGGDFEKFDSFQLVKQNEFLNFTILKVKNKINEKNFSYIKIDLKNYKSTKLRGQLGAARIIGHPLGGILRTTFGRFNLNEDPKLTPLDLNVDEYVATGSPVFSDSSNQLIGFVSDSGIDEDSAHFIEKEPIRSIKVTRIEAILNILKERQNISKTENKNFLKKESFTSNKKFFKHFVIHHIFLNEESQIKLNHFLRKFDHSSYSLFEKESNFNWLANTIIASNILTKSRLQIPEFYFLKYNPFKDRKTQGLYLRQERSLKKINLDQCLTMLDENKNYFFDRQFYCLDLNFSLGLDSLRGITFDLLIRSLFNQMNNQSLVKLARRLNSIVTFSELTSEQRDWAIQANLLISQSIGFLDYAYKSELFAVLLSERPDLLGPKSMKNVY